MSGRGQRGASLHQNGLTLIELMVSLTIGVIASIAIFSAYLGASSASKMADAQSRMNEDAHAALLILTQQLRMAGSNPDQPDRVDNPDPSVSSRRNPVYGTTTFFIRGCDGKFNDVASTPSFTLDTLECPAGATSSPPPPDSVAINYEADKFNTVPTNQASGESPTDCVGNALPAITAFVSSIAGTGTATTTTTTTVTYAVARNVFYVDTSPSRGTTTSLYCKGNGIAPTSQGPQALVENLEDLQFLYGAASTTSTTATIAGYWPASEFPAQAQWSNVLSVRICVLVHSEQPVLSSAAPTSYRNCEGALVINPDGRLRQAYFSTVALRNRRL